MATTKGSGGDHAGATFSQDDSSVVVVIGSGAGGGTAVHDLTAAGVNVVCLEAGAYFTIDDWVNNEWEAFGQMAGRGIIGMRERAALFGGELVAGPRAERGYAVSATLPLGAPGS